MAETSELTIKDMAAALDEIGLHKGDSVIVHSSFRSLGACAQGPRGVIQALLEVIGPTGNLMLPTFNYTRPLPEPFFDPVETPARTGIIPETGRKWPGAVRSLHPTHSVAVIGLKAEYLTQDHLKCRAFGIDSPIDRLAQMGGKVLLIGVTNLTNSTIHIAEDYAGTPKVSWYDPLPMVKTRMMDGSIINHKLDTSPSCSSGFGAVDYILRKKDRIRDGRIRGSKLQLMKGKDVIEDVCELLKENPSILLCNWPGCQPCAGARKNLSR